MIVRSLWCRARYSASVKAGNRVTFRANAQVADQLDPARPKAPGHVHRQVRAGGAQHLAPEAGRAPAAEFTKVDAAGVAVLVQAQRQTEAVAGQKGLVSPDQGHVLRPVVAAVEVATGGIGSATTP